jgi:hypothetical protein
MEKGKLEELLHDFTSDQHLSAELFFVYKNSSTGTYVPYVTKPDEELVKDIINSFTAEVQKFAIPESIFELHHVLTDNENPGYYIYYDDVDSTTISKDIFSSKLAEAPEYDSSKGEFSTIFGFLINIYNGTTGKNLLIFKKNNPTQSMSKSKVIGLFPKNDGSFTSIENDSVFFQKNVDIFRVDNKIIVRNYKVYETNFKYDEVIQKKLAAALKKLLAIEGFWFSEKALEHIAKLTSTKRRKLISCLDDKNPMLSDDKYLKIKSYVRKYFKHEYKITADDKIKIETNKDINFLITFLNREINRNSVTNEVFHTPNKKHLGNYKPKAKPKK